MIPKKYEFFVFAFLMSLTMSFIMSGIITFINLGAVDGFFGLWINAFWKAFIAAFPTILIVVPRVRQVVRHLVRDE